MAEPILDRIGGSDLSGPRLGGSSDDRTGLVLIAVGIALAGFALVVSDPKWMRYGLGGALFPILIGAALLVRYFMLRQSGGRGVAAGS